jgi:2-C-methyl-D-erythritol 4-phosphate cytidylyltransferase
MTSSTKPIKTTACHVLIACGGSGSRAGGALPKQYQPLAGKPLVWHTLMAFMPLLEKGEISSVTVVIAKDDTYWSNNELASVISRIRVVPLASITRALTVTQGLAELLESRTTQPRDWVLVHDAARCLVRTEDIMSLINSCRNDEVGGLLALPLADTLKEATADSRVKTTLPRAGKWLAQTPQMFRAQALLSALKAAGDAVTDEASAMEQQGFAPILVRSSSSNFKVTYAEDFALAEAVLLSTMKGRMS